MTSSIAPILGGSGSGGLSSRSSVPPLSSSSNIMSTSFSSYTTEVIADNFTGVFLESLYRVFQDVHLGFGIQREALGHVESLITQLLAEILNKHPTSIADVNLHIQSCFPPPLNSWTVREANETISKFQHKRPKEKEKHINTCAHRIAAILKERTGWKCDLQVIVYIVAALEYIAADILKVIASFL